jgi:hypothetical protein
MVGAVVTRSVLNEGRGRARAARANESATTASRRPGAIGGVPRGGAGCAKAMPPVTRRAATVTHTDVVA